MPLTIYADSTPYGQNPNDADSLYALYVTVERHACNIGSSVVPPSACHARSILGFSFVYTVGVAFACSCPVHKLCPSRGGMWSDRCVFRGRSIGLARRSAHAGILCESPHQPGWAARAAGGPRRPR